MPDTYKQSYHDLGKARSKSAKRRPDASVDFGSGAQGARADRQVGNWIVEQIRSGRLDHGRVFLGHGIYRPHLPMVVGSEWFDLYQGTPELPPGYWPGALTHEDNIPDLDDLPPLALSRIQARIGNLLTANDELHDFLRAYYASTSFADSIVGMVLNALEARGLMDHTYLVVTSDHGFMLGEKRDFTKFDLREVALQVPLFIAGPGISAVTIDAPVTLVDLFPTLCGLLGIQVPAQCSGRDLSGVLLRGEDISSGIALSYSGDHARPVSASLKFRSVRTADWRLISYSDEEFELYNHREDPFEWHNLANEKPEVVRELVQLLPPISAMADPVREVASSEDDGD